MATSRLQVDRLRREIVARGWDGVDLAYHAQVSPATISSAMQGRPVSADTVHKIVLALSRHPRLADVEELVG